MLRTKQTRKLHFQALFRIILLSISLYLLIIDKNYVHSNTFFAVGQEVLTTTRESIIASREKRHKQLVNVLERTQKKIDDHYSGKVLMDDEKLDFMKSKIRAYEHQIGELGRELDEEEILHMIERAEENRRRREMRDEL